MAKVKVVSFSGKKVPASKIANKVSKMKKTIKTIGGVAKYSR